VGPSLDFFRYATPFVFNQSAVALLGIGVDAHFRTCKRSGSKATKREKLNEKKKEH